MVDISKWRTFNKETNMAGISVLQIFQSEESYLNTAILNSNTPLIETDNINTAQHLRVYSNRDLLPQLSTRSFKQR